MKVMEVSEGGQALITSDYLKVVVDYGFGDAIKTIVNDNFQMFRHYQSPGLLSGTSISVLFIRDSNKYVQLHK